MPLRGKDAPSKLKKAQSQEFVCSHDKSTVLDTYDEEAASPSQDKGCSLIKKLSLLFIINITKIL